MGLPPRRMWRRPTERSAEPEPAEVFGLIKTRGRDGTGATMTR
ncbi:MAG: hypothetical protein RIR43_539 [Pseudomonadota bacterium]